MANNLSKSQPAVNIATQIVTGGALLARIVVQAAAAGVADFYDNTATAGQPIFTVPASAAVGTIYELNIPCTTGLRCVIGAVGPLLTVVFTGGS